MPKCCELLSNAKTACRSSLLAERWPKVNESDMAHNSVVPPTFGKVSYFTPKLSGELGHQWGDLSQGGFDYTYWSAALTSYFNVISPLELEIRDLDSFDMKSAPTCPPSGVFACNSLIVGSLKAIF